MAYGLTFSERFFLTGDPDDMERSERPKCVYQALLSMRQETWDQMARDVFGCDPARLDPFTVLEQVRETDTCSNLDSPVQVWIDAEGWYDVLVYDEPDESRDSNLEWWHGVQE
ncbi:MAG: hypothetical protein KDA93_25095 [Planctomycetaceae bacterium]|nr:hypothetical protein [Planctomycetaceae bacterium]